MALRLHNHSIHDAEEICDLRIVGTLAETFLREVTDNFQMYRPRYSKGGQTSVALGNAIL